MQHQFISWGQSSEVELGTYINVSRVPVTRGKPLEPRARVARQDGLHAIKENNLRASLRNCDGATTLYRGAKGDELEI